jgi:hypothetical protein
MKNLRKYLRKIHQKSLQDLLQVEAGRDFCTSARHHNTRHNDNQPNDK